MTFSHGNRLMITALVCGLWALVACDRGTHDPGRSDYRDRPFTEAEMDTLVVKGMNALQVSNILGDPGSITQINTESSMWTYSFPVQPQQTVPHLGGITVHFKEGKVQSWSPIIEESRQTMQAGGSYTRGNEKTFGLVVADETLSDAVKIVHQEGNVDAQTHAVEPELYINAQVFSGTTGNERPGEQTVILVLSKPDAEKVKTFTANAFGKALLIVWEGKVVAAPTISAPLSSRQLTFTVKDSSILR